MLKKLHLEITIPLIIAGAMVCLWLNTPKINIAISRDINGDTKNITTETVGQVGDLYGSINSIFSGLAFLGVIVSILLQKAELRQNTIELSGQRKALNEQVLLMALQARLTALPEQIRIKKETIKETLSSPYIYKFSFICENDCAFALYQINKTLESIKETAEQHRKSPPEYDPVCGTAEMDCAKQEDQLNRAHKEICELGALFCDQDATFTKLNNILKESEEERQIYKMSENGSI